MLNQSHQFYPTPQALAERAFALFSNKHISRLLEPSAGNGDLLAGDKHRVSRFGGIRYPVDVIEIDASRHPALSAKDLNVVGHDFDQFGSLSIYSHVLMNPPFSKGAKHVLKAWDGLFHGEVVAILNAETIRNPFSSERQHLVNLIAAHGTVEFVQNAFLGDGVQRETAVEVALVHLTKVADASGIVGDILGELRADAAMQQDLATDAPANALMLPTSYVENAVLIFDAAVQACKQAHAAQAKADYYKGWLGKSMAEFLGDTKCEKICNVPGNMRDSYSTEYMELKDRAWTHILNSANLDEKISLNARKRLHADFEKIKCLEFTAANIYGFLQGLSESAWEIQRDMICETFDLFTRYGSDNSVFYMGWKSNDRHKSCGMRLKSTRFILPGFSNQGLSFIGYNEIKRLEDIEKSFLILDGKQKTEVSLAGLFKTQLQALESGERVASDYFEVRYYPRRGTVHFFPTRKDLVDRLNRLVGQWRQWLPPQDQEASAAPAFWKQYEQAEKYSTEIEAKFNQRTRGSYVRLGDIQRSTEPGTDGAKALEYLHEAISSTLQGHGYSLASVLGCESDKNQVPFTKTGLHTSNLSLEGV